MALTASVAAQAQSAWNKQASIDLIRRVLPSHAADFEVAYLPAAGGKDVFEISEDHSKVLLSGNNGVSVASAFYYYLRHFCGCDIGWNGSNLKVPEKLPVVGHPIRKESPYKYRYALNYCTFNYTMSWWDWKRWQWEIDWMAMNGINMPLAVTGEEAIWDRVYRDMGFSEADLRQFYSGPAYFAWFRMGNLDSWGGPLPRHWIQSHEELQKQILQRERSLGMTPVLPAFTGHVPPSFHKYFPTAHLRKTNWGNGFNDVYILDPHDPMFTEIGRRFLQQQEKTYGTDHLYSADTFNENTPPSSDSTYLDHISKSVFNSMSAVDPKAIWVMQGWLFHNNSAFWKPQQIQALLNGIPNDHMIILDLYSECYPVWERTEAYYGKPWIWCMLQNFGGNVSLYGRMNHVAEDPSMALKNPTASKMLGIGITPEGTEQNPALFELMLDNTWTDEPISLDSWLKEYATRRYGQKDADADSAWMILRRTVYQGPKTEGGPESIVTGRPTLHKNTSWTHTDLYYDPLELLKAWKYLLNAAPRLSGSEGYRYDLVDVSRQVLANYATPLQQEFAEAYQQKDKARFDAASRTFLQLIDDMDRLLGTQKDFLLGKWLAEARAWGTTRQEKNLYEFNARDLITLWGDKDCPLHEYACKQWSGLLRGFYKPRWESFFRDADQSLASDRPLDMHAFDEQIKNWEWNWVHQLQHYPARPEGDPVAESKNLYAKYAAEIQAAYK